MKLKYAYIIIFGVIILLSNIISSCKSTNKVASYYLIQKRKYNNGFYVNIFLKKLKTIKNSSIASILIDSKFQQNNKISPSMKKEKIQTLNNDFSDTNTSIKNIIISNRKKGNKENNTLLIDDKSLNHYQYYNKDRGIDSIMKRGYFNNSPINPDGKQNVNGNALAGFICGLFTPLLLLIILQLSVVFYSPILPILMIIGTSICALCAIILSTIGLHQIIKEPSSKKGKILAIIGLIFGIIDITLILYGLIIFEMFLGNI